MTYLGFFDVRTFEPLPVDFVLTDTIKSAIIEAGKLTLKNLRDECDYDSAAHFMAFCDGMWWFSDGEAVQNELRHFFPGFFNDGFKSVCAYVLNNHLQAQAYYG